LILLGHLQKSSSLKLLAQFEPNLAWMIHGSSSTKTSFWSDQSNNVAARNNSSFWLVKYKKNPILCNYKSKWFITCTNNVFEVCCRDSSFVLMAAIGNSCFWLAEALEVLSSESTNPNDLKLGASEVFHKDFSFKLDPTNNTWQPLTILVSDWPKY